MFAFKPHANNALSEKYGHFKCSDGYSSPNLLTANSGSNILFSGLAFSLTLETVNIISLR